MLTTHGVIWTSRQWLPIAPFDDGPAPELAHNRLIDSHLRRFSSRKEPGPARSVLLRVSAKTGRHQAGCRGRDQTDSTFTKGWEAPPCDAQCSWEC